MFYWAACSLQPGLLAVASKGAVCQLGSSLSQMIGEKKNKNRSEVSVSQKSRAATMQFPCHAAGYDIFSSMVGTWQCVKCALFPLWRYGWGALAVPEEGCSQKQLPSTRKSQEDPASVVGGWLWKPSRFSTVFLSWYLAWWRKRNCVEMWVYFWQGGSHWKANTGKAWYHINSL